MSGAIAPGRGAGSQIPPLDRRCAPPRSGRPRQRTPPLRGRATPAADARNDREIRMAKGDVARPRKARGAEPTPEPEFVQLLTPEGERVDHPSYTVDFTDEEYRGLYRDLVTIRRL